MSIQLTGDRFDPLSTIPPLCYPPSYALRSRVACAYFPPLRLFAISQTLAKEAFQRANRTTTIVDAVGFARVVAKLVFREVAVQVMLATVLIHAAHTAFEDRERAFNPVGVDGTVFGVGELHTGVGSGAVIRKLATNCGTSWLRPSSNGLRG